MRWLVAGRRAHRPDAAAATPAVERARMLALGDG